MEQVGSEVTDSMASGISEKIFPEIPELHFDDSNVTVRKKNIQTYQVPETCNFQEVEEQLKAKIEGLQECIVISNKKEDVQKAASEVFALKRKLDDIVSNLSAEDRDRFVSRIRFCQDVTMEAKKDAKETIQQLRQLECTLSSRSSKLLSKGTRKGPESVHASLKTERYKHDGEAAALKAKLSYVEREYDLKLKQCTLEKGLHLNKIQQEIAESRARSVSCLDAEKTENPFGIHEDDFREPIIIDETMRLDLHSIPQLKAPKKLADEAKPAGSSPITHVIPSRVDKKKKDTYVAQSLTYRLPDIKVDVFDGTPIKFPSWETAFDALVESRSSCVAQRLNLLQQHLRGEPRELVDGLFLLQSEEAYYEARRKLKERYGNDSLISKAFTDRLYAWPRLQQNDSMGLRRFSDFLNQVLVAKKKIHSLQILDFANESAKIVSRLPLFATSRWKDVVLDWKRNNNGMYPPFEALASFVHEQAEKENIPELQQIGESKISQRRSGNSTSPRFSAFNTTAKRDGRDSVARDSAMQPYCFFCRLPHSIQDCQRFVKISRRARRDFLRIKELCYSCGSSQSHIARNCRYRPVCKICKKAHMTCLHIFPGLEDAGCKCTNGAPNIAECNDSSMILPVWVRSKLNPSQEVLCYCILDPQSNNCFISDHLKKQLGIEGVSTTINLCTMVGRNHVTSSQRVRHLEVLSFDRSAIVDLPSTYTRPEIPASKHQIPRPEYALRWKHLETIAASHISPFLTDVPISMLLGTNVPKAIRPRDIVAGSDDEPYAQKSVLGWGMVGLVGANYKRQPSRIFTHRCDAIERLASRNCSFAQQRQSKEIINPESIRNWMELDFHERQDGLTISAQDKRFIHILQNNIVQLEDGHYQMPLLSKRIM
ncbi:uncharacterized protein LOC104265901 [Ciona intestinalis]